MTLNPSQIATELIRLSKDAYLRSGNLEASSAVDHRERDAFSQIFRTLRERTGVDFSEYKTTTTSRRIRRRMAVHRIGDVTDYAEFLNRDAEECGHLHQDMLIRVTGFFRDPDVFDFLREEVLPGLIEKREEDNPLRVWVPGCATGEEVYSLAITIMEVASKMGRPIPFQIFGTDVSERAIELAREGNYPENIIQQVPGDLIERYFTSLDGSYKISRTLRDSCVFAIQDLTKDPPFSQLDMASCRNVLIYLEANLQRRVFAVLRYALKAGGILMLGSSETTGSSSELFRSLHISVDQRRVAEHERRARDRQGRAAIEQRGADDTQR